MNSISDQDIPINNLVEAYPVIADFFTSFNLNSNEIELSFSEFIDTLNDQFWEDNGLGKLEFENLFSELLSGLANCEETSEIKTLEVLAGMDKSGEAELCNLQLKPGEITCIVGPTGSGKSRLLADIEWLANEDTPTKRVVKINGKTSSDDIISQYGGKLIAQITQNMNFVLDMDVESFLMLHAQSRFIPNAQQVVDEVIELANELSGESFKPDTPVTFLSGGQSRALMIADVACIGKSPIVLIDEIENAGVNKKKALELLVQKDKIVLMATHDPLLILLADKRVVIKNGGMRKIVETNEIERKFYHELEQLDEKIQLTKNFFRNGNEMSNTSELI